MKIVERIMVNNPCFKTPKLIKPKGIMLHSVGCPQPKANGFIIRWNKLDAQVSVHGFIEPDTVYKILPYNYKAWHCGGAANNTHISFEMTEPKTIKYTKGSVWIDLNPEATKAHVLNTYKTAVELFAKLCKEYKLDPLAKGVIISHSEGSKMGVASNHGDVEHIWSKMGLTMNGFRNDVKSEMDKMK